MWRRLSTVVFIIYVGSCTSYDKILCLFFLFCVVLKWFFFFKFSESVAAEKITGLCWKLSFFLYLVSLYNVLEFRQFQITLLHVHKFVTLILFSASHFSSSHELSWRSLHGGHVKTTAKSSTEWRRPSWFPKFPLFRRPSCQILVKVKSNTNWCQNRVRESLSLSLFFETY